MKTEKQTSVVLKPKLQKGDHFQEHCVPAPNTGASQSDTAGMIKYA